MPNTARRFAFFGLALSAALLGCAASPSTGTPPGTGGGNGSGGAPGTGGVSTTGSGGASNSGSGGAASTIVTKPPSAYPQNAASGGSFPFPQGHAYPNCAFPAYKTDDVQAAYTAWKSMFYQGGRIVRPENSNDTVSEGIAYGMLIGVYMNDKSMFDALWTYAMGKRDGNGLMNWHYDMNGSMVSPGGATDADEDMAWALLMAGAQWGGTYHDQAVTLIDAIWDHEVDTNGDVLKPGDNFGGASETDPSYFMPSYYRVFAQATTHGNWMAVVDSSYAYLQKAWGTYGLVPNWINSSGAGIAGPTTDGSGIYFGFDACRTPWRIAIDYCVNGELKEPGPKTYLDKIVGFYESKSPTGIKRGYATDGSAAPAVGGLDGSQTGGLAFIGPGGVAAIEGGHDAFVASAYGQLVNGSTIYLTTSGVFNYFQGSWDVLSFLAMSGNFWNLTAP
jgi:endo-1,4-beta-D-glucanase Y